MSRKYSTNKLEVFMKAVLVDGEVFKGKDGAKHLQEILTIIIKKTIKKRVTEEIDLCIRKKTCYSHWIEEVLPGRITMSLNRPCSDRLLKASDIDGLHQCLDIALYDQNHRSNGGPLSLYFEIIERHFLLKKLQNAGPNHDKNFLTMVFYESTPEKPDENLQEIARTLLKKLELLVVI
jgi:hypothetical protein